MRGMHWYLWCITNEFSDILSIKLTETFHQEDNTNLTQEQMKEVQKLRDDAKARRRDSAAFDAVKIKRLQKGSGVVVSKAV